MSTYDSTDSSMERAAGSAAESITGSIRDATDTSAGRAAAAISEATERNDAQEPTNSTKRSLLLGAAGLSIGISLALNFMGRKHESLLVGQWVPTLLIIALWYQEVKDARGSGSYSSSTGPYGGL